MQTIRTELEKKRSELLSFVKKMPIKYENTIVFSQLLLLSILSSFFMYASSYDSLGKAFTWVMKDSMPYIWTNLSFLGVYSLLYVVSKRLAVVYGTGMVFSVGIFWINRNKYRLRGDFLNLSDLYVWKEALSASQGLTIQIPFTLLLFVLIVGILLMRFRRHEQRGGRVFFSVVCAVSFLACFACTTNEGLAKRLNVKYDHWDWAYEQKYEVNGLFFVLARELYNQHAIKPKGDHQSNVEEILAQYEKESQAPEQPDILFLMSESFFDLRTIESLTLSEDPLPYYDSLKEEAKTGTMLSPSYGGNTAQVEFEALTGNSVSLIGNSRIVYNQFTGKGWEKHSTPMYLKQQGYDAVALHPNDENFYKRNLIYKDMGFDEFISKSEFDEETQLMGKFISDQAVSHKLIDLFEAQGDAPLFVHAITMQNHTPHDLDLAQKTQGRTDITVQGEGLNEDNLQQATYYANLLADTDESLRELFSYLKQREKRTIVVFWGDHLPTLGPTREFYENSGYWRDASEEDATRMDVLHRTDLLVWDSADRSGGELETMGSHYISPYLFGELGFTVPYYEYISQELMPQFRALGENYFLDVQDQVQTQYDAQQLERMQQYAIVQYEMMFGQQK